MDDQQGQPALENSNLPTGSAKTEQGDEAVLSELEKSLTESEEAEAAVGDDQAGDGQSEDDELEEFELGDRRYKVPKALKPHLMRDKDYTQSKQQLAEQRKADEAARKDFEEEQRFHRENVKSVAKITSMDEQIAAFRAVTPEQWAAMGAEKAGNLRLKFDLLKDQRETAVGELRQKEREALGKQQARTAKQFEDGYARIAKAIPTWNDELVSKLNTYGLDNGYTVEELEQMPRQPHQVINLYKSFMFDQAMARTRAKPKTETVPAAVVPTVSAARRAPAAKDPNKMSPEEYRTWRMNGGGSPRAAAR